MPNVPLGIENLAYTHNDEMSSLKIYGNVRCCVILYKHIDYGGSSRKVCNDMTSSQLGADWDNQVSSFNLVPGKYQLFPQDP